MTDWDEAALAEWNAGVARSRIAARRLAQDTLFGGVA